MEKNSNKPNARIMNLKVEQKNLTKQTTNMQSSELQIQIRTTNQSES